MRPCAFVPPAVVVSAVVASSPSLFLPVSCQIAEVSQLITNALAPLRWPLDLLASSSSAPRNEDPKPVDPLNAIAIAAAITDNSLLNSTIHNSQKMIQSVAQTATSLLPGGLADGVLLPTEDGRRQAVAFNAFDISPLDQAIINAVGEVRRTLHCGFVNWHGTAVDVYGSKKGT